MSTILVADDESRIREVLRRVLVNDGHSVVEAADGAAVIAEVTDDVDLVLLDLMMPQVNGLQVLARLRDDGRSMPVIFLSGVGQVSTRVQALEAGAVDFMVKPFHPAELVARVRRHLNRDGRPETPASQEIQFLSAGGVRLDLDRRRVLVGDSVAVGLGAREFALLAHLMRRKGRVCRRDELLHDVWGFDFDPGSNVVEVAVRRLRRRVDQLPLETVRGVGYCFATEA